MKFLTSLAGKRRWLTYFFLFGLLTTLSLSAYSQATPARLSLNKSGYFETRGWNLLNFSNRYGLFGDEKASGVEIIHHGVRTATNGDVRLDATPEQWDSIPQVIRRNVNREANSIETFLKYGAFDFTYSIKTIATPNGMSITVNLDKPLPKALEGRAGFNLEFLPSAYFHKTYLMDGKSGVFPLYPSGPMSLNRWGQTEPQPLAAGTSLVLAPEDAERRITLRSNAGSMALYDGRNKAQNGWYVVRTLIPANQSGAVISWTVSANTIPGWTREPMIAYSQVGYHPTQRKVAVVELDPNDTPPAAARLLKVSADGRLTEKYRSATKPWGPYLRYRYTTFDFTAIKEEGVYVIEYGKQRTTPFRIDADVYASAWQPTLDIYFPVAMDHMFVKEAYRVWHGYSHGDDALQAPNNHVHFDLYAQGATSGTKYKPFEHIPGLNVGGWYDAGDFDIRTQTVYAVVMSLVQSWEAFRLTRDETSINQQTRMVNIHVPDGKPDLLQQIEHGTMQLLAQHKAVGHAIHGIVEAHLSQYTHLGDASTKTDNLVYNPRLDTLESDGFTSGTFDDRWAFTTKSTPLNYGSIAALAAASRALKGYNDTLATDCLQTATRVWEEEHSHAPDIFYHGNTTGGP
ncbi:MAG TPA: glycoside hydrolase family 9 protein, partial [Chitinophagaceae bacterium]